MRKGIFALLFLLLPCQHASAHPVSYQGAVSVMTWNQSYVSDFWTTYSYAPFGAAAARYMRMDMKDGSEMKVALPQADFLLYRKNAKTYQANIYTFGGWGGETVQNSAHGA